MVELPNAEQAATWSQHKNQDRKRANLDHAAAARDRQGDTDGSVPLLPLFKEWAGQGKPFPTQHERFTPMSMLPELNVGDQVPARFFPESLENLTLFWTLEEIENLSILLNEDFGVQAGDSLQACRQKAAAFVLGLPPGS